MIAKICQVSEKYRDLSYIPEGEKLYKHMLPGIDWIKIKSPGSDWWFTGVVLNKSLLLVYGPHKETKELIFDYLLIQNESYVKLTREEFRPLFLCEMRRNNTKLGRLL